MTERGKTTLYVGTAAALFALVIAGALWGNGPAADFQEVGKALFPDFTSPEQATSLEVAEFDAATGRPMPFKVMLRDGRWVIPSHYDYPADAKDRLARTAAGIIDLVRDTYRGDRPEDHKVMGVLDPLDSKTFSPDGLGKRVTLRDNTDRVLADLIIGKTIESQPDQRYVRVPGQNAVYGVKLSNVDISTRFTDWIDTNLLNLDQTSVRQVIFPNVKIDGNTGKLLREGEVVADKLDPAKRPPGSSFWSVDIPIPPAQEVNTTALDTLTSTLANLKIAGVRPKPAGLSADLRGGDGSIKLDEAAMRSLLSIGFTFFQNALISKEGAVYVTCDDGVVYNLHFGALTFARGEALSAGKSRGEAKELLEKPAESTASDDLIESRFLFVMVRHSPELVEKPKTITKDELPNDVFARDKPEREALEKRAADTEKREREAYEKKLADGAERAKKLNERFAGWYYVVPGDSFRKIVLDRAALTRPIVKAPAAGAAPGGFPPGFPVGDHPPLQENPFSNQP
jgi:hypothetical protein